jgi:hypothetical protein
MIAGISGGTEPVWSTFPGTLVTDGTVTWNTIHNVGNGYTYFCAAAGTSGATEPVWPLTTGGTVVDGTVTWQFGTTIATQISRAISIGDSDPGTVSYGAAVHFVSQCYDAICEFSGASLVGSSAAAIRLAREMPIDFSGNQTPAGQNNHTLRFTMGAPSDEPEQAGFGRLSYQIDSLGHEGFACEDIGIFTVGHDLATTSVLAVNSAAGAQRQLRFLTANVLRWAILTNLPAETGSGNVGGDFRVRRYDDSGTPLGNDPLTITRATGAIILGTIPTNAANDAAAATAGVALGGIYRNGSVLMVRIA